MAAAEDQTDPSATTRVGIAVPTFHREEQLKRLLQTVAGQAHDLTTDVGSIEILVTVIDNDPAGGARATVEAVETDGIEIRYVNEQTPGVVAVRNRALQENADRDVVIFIDDDQLPLDGWLQALIKVWISTGASVAGPVQSEVPADASRWIRESGAFDRAYRDHLTTGDAINEVATTNLLLDLRTVQRLGLRFDETFALSGGEDSLFTRTLTRSGARILWSREAVVLEAMPTTRLTKGWVCRRALSSGNGAALVSLQLEERRAIRTIARLRLLASGGARVGGGLANLGLGLAEQSISRQGRATRTTFRGLGLLLGALGVSYLEYARDGRRLRRTSQLSAAKAT